MIGHILRHIGLTILSYTGFIRMVASYEIYQETLFFSHTFEILISAGPLMAIQIMSLLNL